MSALAPAVLPDHLNFPSDLLIESAELGLLPDEQLCPTCEGSGEVHFNPSRHADPQCEQSAPCSTCAGNGTVPAASDLPLP